MPRMSGDHDSHERTIDQLPIVAETDIDSVGFYRQLGFVVTTLGEKYPGVEHVL